MLRSSSAVHPSPLEVPPAANAAIVTQPSSPTQASSSEIFEAPAWLDTSGDSTAGGIVRLTLSHLEWTSDGENCSFDLRHVKATHAGRKGRPTLQVVMYSGEAHVINLGDPASGDEEVCVAKRDALHAALKERLSALPKRGVLDEEVQRALSLYDDELFHAERLSGLKWRRVAGHKKPSKRKELTNVLLATALAEMTESARELPQAKRLAHVLPREEWDACGITGLRMDHVIKVGCERGEGSHGV